VLTEARRRIVLPVDVPSLREADALVRPLLDHIGVVKIGLQLYTAAGPEAVHWARDLGRDIFLDIKLHDIPSTVARATESAARLGVRFLTVHAAGGSEMLRAAAAAAGDVELLAVTLLTSISPEALWQELCISLTVVDIVHRMAEMARRQGILGAVCSPGEAASLRRRYPDATLMVPGIRLPGDPCRDQRRTATPSEALRAGASYLVVGRSVTRAADPVAAARAVAHDIAPALDNQDAM